MEYKFFRIGRTRILITNQKDSALKIKQLLQKKAKGYICISNMRTVVLANTDDQYHDIMENSLFNTPDGTPLVWCGKAWGINDVERACGPYLFDDIIKDKDPSLKHFLLGDTEETEKKLKYKCEREYGTHIVGMYSPPFMPLEEYNLKEIADIINRSGANIVWTSLRAPKQDFLNAKLLPYLNDGIILIGVGAAFRYKLGELRKPDGFLQKIGLGGLIFRRKDSNLLKELKWYLKHGYYFTKYFSIILIKRLLGHSYAK